MVMRRPEKVWTAPIPGGASIWHLSSLSGDGMRLPAATPSSVIGGPGSEGRGAIGGDFGLSATTERDRGFADSLLEGAGFEPSVPLATVSLILAEEKGLQADPARAGTAA
jgi:hypothetical protein